MWLAPENEEDSVSRDYQKVKHCHIGYLRHTYGSGLYACKRNLITLIRGVAWPCIHFRKFAFMAGSIQNMDYREKMPKGPVYFRADKE